MKSIMTETGISIEMNRKKIKNIYLRVYPAEGRVVLSYPWYAADVVIMNFVREKIPWIKKQLKNKTQQEPDTEIRYISGDEIVVWGKKWMLKVSKTHKPQSVIFAADSTIILCVKKNSTAEKRKKMLDQWLRVQLKERIRWYVTKWEPIMNVTVNEFGVKKMRTRWGTCNIRAKRIWLNLELVKFDKRCLESVVVHEMVHLLERKHSERFYRLMDQFLPDWKEREKVLRYTGTNFC